MDEQFIEALRRAVRDTMRTAGFDVRERRCLCEGGASAETEQAFAESVADALERRLVFRALTTSRRPLLN